MSGSNPQKPLAGVRVIDLCQYIPGPFASLKMAEMGAQVIKVEPPGGDPMRALGMGSSGVSSLYKYLNRGKTVVEIDLKTASGKEHLGRLTGSTQVLMEGFRPGTLERLGFDRETLSGINASLIVCRITGFGQTGKDVMRAGHDLGYAARAGLYAQAATSTLPQIVFPPVADHASSLKAMADICAALYRREKTGAGCVLDVSISEVIVDWSYMFDLQSVAALLSGASACYHIYQTSDGAYVTLAALEAKFWQVFCEAVDKLEWTARHADALPQTALIEEVSTLFKTRSLANWKEIFMNIDCCFEAVISTGQLRNGKIAENLASECTLPEYKSVNVNEIRWSA
jgi:alpha-methylacyl-CoA racemase